MILGNNKMQCHTVTGCSMWHCWKVPLIPIPILGCLYWWYCSYTAVTNNANTAIIDTISTTDTNTDNVVDANDPTEPILLLSIPLLPVQPVRYTSTLSLEWYVWMLYISKLDSDSRCTHQLKSGLAAVGTIVSSRCYHCTVSVWSSVAEMMEGGPPMLYHMFGAMTQVEWATVGLSLSTWRKVVLYTGIE